MAFVMRETGWDLWPFRNEGPMSPIRRFQSKASEPIARFSFAYESDEFFLKLRPYLPELGITLVSSGAEGERFPEISALDRILGSVPIELS